MKRLLREPLLHFLLLGAVLFVAFQYTQPSRQAAPSKQVQLSPDDLSRLVRRFQTERHREPTPPELDRLVEDKVQEEILYREALAMGLDQNDEIIKRRLAQKLQILAEAVATAHEPTTTELKTWYATNSVPFALPKRFSFRQLLLATTRHGTNTHADAVKALAQLSGQPQDAPLAAALADPSMLQDHYRDLTPEYLSKEFGPQFTQALEKLTPGSWQGPIESSLGWHLVFVDTVVPESVLPFEEVEADVKTAWLEEQKAAAWQKAYQNMRAQYTVALPGALDNARAALAPATNASHTPAGSSEGGTR